MGILVYVLLSIVGIIAILAIIAPKSYDVFRAVEVDKPKAEIFEYLRLLKNQDNWSPWAEKDPSMKKEFVGTDGESGFISKWTGNKEVGEGEQELKKIVTNERIESELRFFKPFKSQSDAYLQLEAVSEDKTKVIWGFSGNNKFPISIMMLFMNMDKNVGKDFESGLSKLKGILEN